MGWLSLNTTPYIHNDMFYYYLPAVCDRCCKTWFDMMLAVVSASSSKSGPSANRVFMSYRQIGSLPLLRLQ